MRMARHSLAVGVLDGIMYAVGGGADRIVEAYDPAANAWTMKTPLPRTLSAHAIGVVNGGLYVVGGDPRRPDGKNDTFKFVP